jgi:intracellular septation protein
VSETRAKGTPGWLPAALDYAPLILFFIGYKLLGVLGGTAIFMVAIAAAVIISKWKLGRISPMMWMSAILVLVFGGLTLYLHDPKFIQIKPTIIYSILSAILFGGLLRGRALLKAVLEHGYDGLSDRGWLLLSRNWAWFFAAMAVVNEILRRSVGFDAWLTIKVWGVTILTILFATANVPMLMRHGLGADEKDSAQ